MTIKSDIWLRKMAEECGMITPFLCELVREADGKRIISAGCSSYGYDFRQFTAKRSTRSVLTSNFRSSNRRFRPQMTEQSTICFRRIIMASA